MTMEPKLDNLTAAASRVPDARRAGTGCGNTCARRSAASGCRRATTGCGDTCARRRAVRLPPHRPVAATPAAAAAAAPRPAATVNPAAAPKPTPAASARPVAATARSHGRRRRPAAPAAARPAAPVAARPAAASRRPRWCQPGACGRSCRCPSRLPRRQPARCPSGRADGARQEVPAAKPAPAPLPKTDVSVQQAIRRSKRQRFRLIVGSLFAMVVLPTLLSGIYFFWIASDQYVVEARFAVRGSDPSSSAEMMGMMSGAGSVGTIGDSYILQDFVASRDIINRIEKTIPLREMYQALAGRLSPAIAATTPSRISPTIGARWWWPHSITTPASWC